MREKYYATVTMTVEILADSKDEARYHALRLVHEIRLAAKSDCVNGASMASSYCHDKDIDVEVSEYPHL